MSIQQCQNDVSLNLQALLATGEYTWCDINNDLKNVADWFDDSKSWIHIRWFDSTSWSSRINFGQYIIFNSQQLLFIIVSVLANAYIFYYHMRYPHHPKFTLSLAKKITIAVHVLSGVIGVLIPLYVFFSINQYIGTIIMYTFVATDFAFAITAIKQAPNVYGVRSITVPLYYMCIACKMILTACLFQSLLVEPLGGYKSQVEWLWMCWVVHQTYAWVRVWYMTFFWADALIGHQYTISVFLAGSMCVGASFGFYLWIIWMVSLVSTYAYIHLRVKKVKLNIPKPFHLVTAQKQLSFMRDDEKQWRETLRELYDKEDRHEALSKQEEADKGKLTLKALEIAQMWEEAQPNIWRNSPGEAEEALEFLQNQGVTQLESTSKDLKAQVLFRYIDKKDRYGQRKGTISTQEFKVFLIGFGVSDVHNLFKNVTFGPSIGEVIDFPTFSSKFGDFYEYAFDGLCQWADHTSQKSDINDIDTIVERVVEKEFRRKSLLEAPQPVRRINELRLSFEPPTRKNSFSSVHSGVSFLRSHVEKILQKGDAKRRPSLIPLVNGGESPMSVTPERRPSLVPFGFPEMFYSMTPERRPSVPVVNYAEQIEAARRAAVAAVSMEA